MSVQKSTVGVEDSQDPNAIPVAVIPVPWQGPTGSITANAQGFVLVDPSTGNTLGLTTALAIPIDGSATVQPVSHIALTNLTFDAQNNLLTTTRGFGKSGYAAVPTGALTAPVSIGSLPAGTRKVEFTLKSNDMVQFVIATTNPGDVSSSNAVSPQISGNASNPGMPNVFSVDVDVAGGWNVWIANISGTPQWRAL